MASLLAASASASAAKRRLPMLMSCYARLSSSTRYFDRSRFCLMREREKEGGSEGENLGKTRKIYAPHKDLETPAPRGGWLPEPCISETKYNKPQIKVVSQLLNAKTSPREEKLQQDDTIPSPIPISGNGPEIKDVSQLLTAEASPIKEKLQQDDTIPSPEPISEMKHEPSNANQATGKKRKNVKKEVESVLINALERNNELLRAQLEDQKSSFQLAREEHKEQHERLVATLTKITGVLEKIADKL